MLGSAWLSYKRIFMKSYQKLETPAKLPLACSRLRDSGESEKSFKNKKTRGGWGEIIASFAKSRASYFALLVSRPHYTIWEPGTG